MPRLDYETQIPIYRALKLGTEDEYVKGFLVPPYKGKHYISIEWEHYISTEWKHDGDTGFLPNLIEIDLSTLEISFDNGDRWFRNFELIGEVLKGFDGKGVAHSMAMFKKHNKGKL